MEIPSPPSRDGLLGMGFCCFFVGCFCLPPPPGVFGVLFGVLEMGMFLFLLGMDFLFFLRCVRCVFSL